MDDQYGWAGERCPHANYSHLQLHGTHLPVWGTGGSGKPEVPEGTVYVEYIVWESPHPSEAQCAHFEWPLPPWIKKTKGRIPPSAGARLLQGFCLSRNWKPGTTLSKARIFYLSAMQRLPAPACFCCPGVSLDCSRRENLLHWCHLICSCCYPLSHKCTRQITAPPWQVWTLVKGKKIPNLPRRWGQSSLEEWYFLADTEPTAVCYSAGPLRQPTSPGSWELRSSDFTVPPKWRQTNFHHMKASTWHICITPTLNTVQNHRLHHLSSQQEVRTSAHDLFNRVKEQLVATPGLFLNVLADARMVEGFIQIISSKLCTHRYTAYCTHWAVQQKLYSNMELIWRQQEIQPG